MNKTAEAKKRMPLVWRMTLTNAVMLFVLLAVFTTGFVLALFSEITHTRKLHLSESLDDIETRLSKAGTLSPNVFDSIHLKKAVQFAVYNQDSACLYTTVKGMPPLTSLDGMSAAIRFNGEDPLGELKEDYEYTISSSRWVTQQVCRCMCIRLRMYPKRWRSWKEYRCWWVLRWLSAS